MILGVRGTSRKSVCRRVEKALRVVDAGATSEMLAYGLVSLGVGLLREYADVGAGR